MSDEPLHAPPEATDPVLNTGNAVIVGTPAAGTQLAGDVTGTTSAATVAKIQGKAVPAPGAPEAGKVLRYNAGTDATEWITPAAGGGGISVVDKSAFVEGTDSFTPIGGIYDEVQGADPAEDSAIVLRMTVKRAAHVNLRTATGTEIGTAGSPLRTDPTGGTTQPISGTVTANQGGTWTVQPGNTANTTAWKVDGSAVTQPVSAVSLPLPAGAAQEHTTAASPHAVRLTDGAAFYKGTTPADTQPVSGSVSVSNLAADQLVHAANLDIATSALRDAITAAGAAAKTLADVVTAITQVQATNGAALPALLGAAAGYDADQQKVRPIPVAIIDGTPRATVDDARVRNELRQIRLVLCELVELQRAND